MTPLEKEQITQAPEFVEFIDRTSKLIERALYVGKAFDITIDYAKRSDEDKYVLQSIHPSIYLSIILFLIGRKYAVAVSASVSNNYIYLTIYLFTPSLDWKQNGK